MYLSADRLALANQALMEAFEDCSIAWQVFPHWDTRDPGQISVADGILSPPGSTLLLTKHKTFYVSLAQANAPTPDSLLTAVVAAAKDLAQLVDDDVIPTVYGKAPKTPITKVNISPKDLQDPLLDAREAVENAGYRAPSCLITNMKGLKKLNEFVSGYVNISKELMLAANVNALHRATKVNPADPKTRLILIGRRRRIAQGAAPEASPGEEPVDLAVALFPSLEIVGETSTGAIEINARIRYVTRVTDATGLAAIKHN